MKTLKTKNFKTGAGVPVKVYTYQTSGGDKTAIVQLPDFSQEFRQENWKVELYAAIFNGLFDFDTYWKVGVYLIDFFAPL